MPAPTDAELVTRAADGEQAAFTELFERYADRVHDHVARWSRDSELAAEATRHAFAALLDDLDSLREEQFVLVWLLRTARTHAVDQLRHTESDNDRADTRIAAALLAATPTDPAASPGDAAVSHDAAQLVWELAADLDDRTFTVLDLHVRQELSGPEIAAVLDTTLQEADALADRMRERLRTLSGAEVLRGASPLPVYGALARVRAPVSVRNGAMAAAADHFGTTPRPTGLHRALPLGIALLVLLGLVGGIASALRSTDPEPAGGPPTAAAELLPSPSPEPSPSPTPTLEALASASPEPTVVEEPTPTPEPSPSPTPSPTADPNPSPQPLAVSIDQPLADASFAATVQDDQGRQAAWVTVSATIDGGDQGTSIAWSSDRAPDDELLDTASGELLLWLSEPCTHTAHLLTVTAADGAGEEATDTVPVRITDTCKERLTVTIDRPRAPRTEGPFQRDPDDKTVTFRVAATASDDDVTWLWTTDDRGSMQRAPEGPRGQVSVVIDDCSTSASFTLLVEVSRADGSTAQHEREVRVDCGD